jgi:hypothetical protein
VKHLPTLKRPARTASVALASAAVTAALTLPGLALAHGGHGHGAVPPPPAAPTSADQIQNIDQVKTAISAYYGDTLTTTPAPGDPTKTLHQFSPDSAYAHEVEGIASDAGKFLAHQKNRHHHQGHFSGKPAIVFDIDDTTLNTFSYEIYSSYVFNGTTNTNFVNAGSASVFPAVPGMVKLEAKAEAKGYTVFFLTGRPESQRTPTEANLTDAGFDFADANVFLKDNTSPWLASCTPTCTRVQYKSLTRQHIESLGYDIVANLGDQFSDLDGGFSDRTFKIPNPMYFLP